MAKKTIVLSLGGSLIVPEKIDTDFLREFKKVIVKNSKNYKFIIVCGGGTVARKYISALKDMGLNEEFQSYAGISATRMNARFMSYMFKINPKKGIPHSLKDIKKYTKSQSVVFCGALEYKPKQTSDSTAVEIASHFDTEFVNLTNVKGLYNKNPKKHKDAKFISEISWGDFYDMANQMEFEPGQHFVLDQTAAKMIKENKVKTYIVGKNLEELDNLLNDKEFKGTTINE